MGRVLQLVVAATVALTAVPISGQSTPTVDEIVARNVKAKGGADLLRQTESVKMTGTFRVFQPSEMTMPMTTWAKRPNLVRQEAEVTPPAGPGAPARAVKMIRAADGKDVWMQRGDGPAQALPATQAAQMIQDSEFDPVFLDYAARGIDIELAGIEKVDGRDAYHLIVKRKNGGRQDYYLDTDSALETRLTTEVTQGGSSAKVTTELSDYRTVEGRVVPFRTRQLVNGQPAAEMTIQTVAFNVPMPDSLFSMPK